MANEQVTTNNPSTQQVFTKESSTHPDRCQFSIKTICSYEPGESGVQRIALLLFLLALLFILFLLRAAYDGDADLRGRSVDDEMSGRSLFDKKSGRTDGYSRRDYVTYINYLIYANVLLITYVALGLLRRSTYVNTLVRRFRQ